jgi:Xaa-Pro aminopeptidase
VARAPATAARAARADRLAEALAEQELDALVVTELVNVRYLTGFTGTNGACLVSADERVFFTDFRYTERAESEVEGFELAPAARDLLADVAKRASGRVGFEDAHLSVRAHTRLEELISESDGDAELVAAGSVVEGLREVKDDGELAAMRAAAELGDEIYEHVREAGLRGRTELEVGREIERVIRERGAEPAFPPIVAAGANGALPHATPADEEIPAGTLVVVDLGCQLDGYCSDCTRTFATGDLSERAHEVYDLVATAQRTALDVVRAGTTGKQADSVARELIDAAGEGERFGHALGHGVGMEVHEGPVLAQRSERELVAGNVVTVEPGVYLPGEFGVRIEDLVVVGEDGREVLSGLPKALTQV